MNFIRNKNVFIKEYIFENIVSKILASLYRWNHGLMQNCGISIALAMEIPQSCTKPLMYTFRQLYHDHNWHCYGIPDILWQHGTAHICVASSWPQSLFATNVRNWEQMRTMWDIILTRAGSPRDLGVMGGFFSVYGIRMLRHHRLGLNNFVLLIIRYDTLETFSILLIIYLTHAPLFFCLISSLLTHSSWNHDDDHADNNFKSILLK